MSLERKQVCQACVYVTTLLLPSFHWSEVPYLLEQWCAKWVWEDYGEGQWGSANVGSWEKQWDIWQHSLSLASHDQIQLKNQLRFWCDDSIDKRQASVFLRLVSFELRRSCAGDKYRVLNFIYWKEGVCKGTCTCVCSLVTSYAGSNTVTKTLLEISIDYYTIKILIFLPIGYKI